MIVFSFASCKQWSTKEKSEHFTRICTLLPLPLLLFPSSSESHPYSLHLKKNTPFPILLCVSAPLGHVRLISVTISVYPFPHAQGSRCHLQLEGKAKKKPDLLPLHLYVHYLLLFLNILKIFICIHFAVPAVSCGMWDLLTAPCELLAACRI